VAMGVGGQRGVDGQAGRLGDGSPGQPGNMWRWAGAGIVDVGWAMGAEPGGGGRGSRATV
jgi:hypothetical protein